MIGKILRFVGRRIVVTLDCILPRYQSPISRYNDLLASRRIAGIRTTERRIPGRRAARFVNNSWNFDR